MQTDIFTRYARENAADAGRYKGMQNTLVAIVFLVLISGCSADVEVTRELYDSHMEAAFEKALIENEIPYEKRGRQFVYSSKYLVQANEIGDKIIERYSNKNMFIFQKSELLSKVTLALDENGLNYEILERDDGTAVSWNENDNEEARRIISEITGIPL